jgi:hypothetical protein
MWSSRARRQERLSSARAAKSRWQSSTRSKAAVRSGASIRWRRVAPSLFQRMSRPRCSRELRAAPALHEHPSR